MDRLVGLVVGLGAGLAPVEVGDHLPAQPQGVHLVFGQVVGQTGVLGVELSAAQRLVVGLLTSGHLDQRWATEEHLGALPDEDVVVGHAGLVGAAGR